MYRHQKDSIKLWMRCGESHSLCLHLWRQTIKVLNWQGIKNANVCFVSFWYYSVWRVRRNLWREIWLSKQTRLGSMTPSWRPSEKTTDSSRYSTCVCLLVCVPNIHEQNLFLQIVLGETTVLMVLSNLYLVCFIIPQKHWRGKEPV